MVIIIANKVEEESCSVKHDVVIEDYSACKFVLALAEWYKGSSKEIITLVFSEFRDSFSPCTSLTTKDSLILNAMTFQLMNLGIRNCICVHLIALGYKGKNSMLTKNKHVEENDYLKNPKTSLKVHSKKIEGACGLCYYFILYVWMRLRNYLAHYSLGATVIRKIWGIRVSILKT